MSPFTCVQALVDAAFLTDRLAQAAEVARHALVHFHDVVESIGNLAGQAGPFRRKAHALLAAAHRDQGMEYGYHFAIVVHAVCGDLRRFRAN
jgi:hypothetical protein